MWMPECEMCNGQKCDLCPTYNPGDAVIAVARLVTGKDLDEQTKEFLHRQDVQEYILWRALSKGGR